jgi:hypothetical protein
VECDPGDDILLRHLVARHLAVINKRVSPMPVTAGQALDKVKIKPLNRPYRKRGR